MRKQQQYNVGIYERLSREDERAGDSVSILTQDQILRKHVAEQGWNLVDVYVDDGYTGGNFKRPAMERLIEDAKAGKINLILVKDLSRFGRNYIEFGQYTDYLFPSIGCRFVALHDGVDTLRDDNDIMPFKNLFNEFYLRDCSKKAKNAKRSMAERGQFIGSYAPYGYKLSHDDQHTLLVDQQAAEVIRKIFRLRMQGVGARGIASALNGEGILPPSAYRGVYTKVQSGRPTWNGNTVASIYSNEVYIGNLVQRKTETMSYKSKVRLETPEEEWVRFNGTHEPIIDDETWASCVRVNDGRRKARASKSGMQHLFSGLLVCKDCGYGMRAQSESRSGGGRYVRYICGRYQIGGCKACSSHAVPERVLRQIILEDIRGKIGGVIGDKEVAQLVERVRPQELKSTAEQAQLQSLGVRLAELDRILCSLYEDKALGRISEQAYADMAEKYRAEQEEKTAQRKRLEERLLEPDREAADIERFLNIAKRYLRAEELSREMLLGLVDQIMVGEKRVVDGKKTQDIEVFYHFIGKL